MRIYAKRSLKSAGQKLGRVGAGSWHSKSFDKAAITTVTRNGGTRFEDQLQDGAENRGPRLLGQAVGDSSDKTGGRDKGC